MLQWLSAIVTLILPHWMHERLMHHRSGIRKYFFNTGWMTLGKLVTFCVSFFTIAIVARYLGPENYGKLSYAQSFVAIFSVFASLGIDQVIYRNLIAEPEKENVWIGTAIVVKTILGFFTILFTLGFAVTLDTEPILTWLVGVIALSFILQPIGIVGHLFNAEVKAKYSTISVLVVSLCIPLLKLLTIFFGGGILYFAALITLEALLYSLVNIVIYVSIFKRSPANWRFSTKTAGNLLQNSWPLALASLSGYIYGRIDQVMIQHFLDVKAVGFYDVAVRLTELAGFFPGAIISSLLPAIISVRHHNQKEYTKRWMALGILCLGITLGLATALYILSPYIINLLFGAEFETSVSLLQIYVWSIIGTIAIILIQQYLIAEEKSKWFLIFSFLGAATNVALNYVLIPRYGVTGAAYATIITLITIISIFSILHFKKFLMTPS